VGSCGQRQEREGAAERTGLGHGPRGRGEKERRETSCRAAEEREGGKGWAGVEGSGVDREWAAWPMRGNGKRGGKRWASGKLGPGGKRGPERWRGRRFGLG
jgi:hypothetical protein